MKASFFFIAITIFLFNCTVIEGQSQSYIVKSIKDFGATGNGITNDSEAFSKAAKFFNARGGNGKLTIPSGTYLVGKQIRKAGIFKGRHLLALKECNNLKIEAAANSKIVYKKAMRFGTFLPFSNKRYTSKDKIVRKKEYLSTVGNCIYLIKCSNIQIDGLELDGSANDAIKGGRYGDKGIQAPYSGIGILDGTNISIKNSSITDFGLDGIYISTTKGNFSQNNISIINTDCTYNGRQGLSIVGGSGIKVDNCKFSYTGKGKFRSNPMAGLDIEPNAGSRARNITIKNSEMIDNVGVGFISMNGDARNVKLKNCLIIGRKNWSSWVQKPDFTFTDCKFYGSIVHGYPAKNNMDRTRYFNCYFSDTTFKTRGRYLAEISSGYNQIFDNCVFSAKSKKVIYHRSRPPSKNLYTQFRNCTFRVNSAKFGPKAFLGILGKVRLINNSFEVNEQKSQLKGKYFKFEGVEGGETNIRKFGVKTVE
jgi:hypothetical protein